MTVTRYTYLGPQGTFTEAALLSLPGGRAAVRVPASTPSAALGAVRRGEADAAVVPLENSVEGVVTGALDDLIRGEPLVITAEALVPVEFALLARPGTHRADVKRVTTHPHAQAQCRGWLARTLPDASLVTASSTAAAAVAVAEGGQDYDAAIAAPLAGQRYGLETLAVGIADHEAAVTRFVMVASTGGSERSLGTELPRPTGADRTSLIAFVADDHPGQLVEILRQFALRGVNLTLVQSRPTGDGLGRYCFLIDCAGHVDDDGLGEALNGVRQVCSHVRLLGSYPRADARR